MESNKLSMGSSNLVKRKVPDSSFYDPPTNPNAFTLAAHSHSNSVPVDPLYNNTVNSNAKYELSSLNANTSIYSPNNYHSNLESKTINNQAFQFNPSVAFNHFNQHVKTYSLPVEMASNSAGKTMVESVAPPVYEINNYSNIPLPAGWSSEKTPEGQIYFIE
jgi:hypothetical protein